MLTKFDLPSARVKGLSFHRQRPWVLCGLHNGDIQIWDYRMNTFVDSFNEHAGAVRGVDFHPSQPLFVSGADDYTVKVWNYKVRRCLYTLNGHLDYVRTTFFHPQQPWIISSSDDYTVRIWNWQNRKCIANLPGHRHYVMCAQFHPTSDLIVSGSLDKTLRVWDISALRTARQQNGLQQDLLGGSEVVMKFQLEAHEKGVNWVAFDPHNLLIVSASDDRTVTVWRYWDTYGSVSWILRGHTNSVCCAVFFRNFVISCGEDHTIRVWNTAAGRNNQIKVFRRETDRYWILATQEERNLIAAGHDAGLQVFKIFRERPPHAVVQDSLYFIHDNVVRVYSFERGTEVTYPLSTPRDNPPYSISVNPGEGQVVAWYNEADGFTSLISIPGNTTPGTTCECKFRVGSAGAVFFGANKYAYVDKNENLCMFNIQGDREKVLETTFRCQFVFPAPVGCLLCQSKDTLYLYQVAQHGSVAECVVPGVKYVVWDKDFHKVALLCSKQVCVMTKKLKVITTIAESTARIKSVAFDETRDVLYYTTSNHLKYCNLRNGECSTISTLKNVVYLVRAKGDTIWVISRDGRVMMRELDNLELNFKLKLQQQSYRDIIRIIQKRELKGQALVGYLHKHGHSEVALHFVTDTFTRFNLAIECGAMEIAKTAATELNEVAVWRRLAEAATKFGDIHLAAFACNKAGNHHLLGLLSLCTGNTDALRQMVQTSSDASFRYQYGLYLDDAETRVKLLLDANQLPLAYAAAKCSGLSEQAEKILAMMSPEVAARAQKISPPKRSQDQPLPASVKPSTDNWPMLQVEESVFSRLLKEPGQFDAGAALGLNDDDALDGGAGWDDDDDDDDGKQNDGSGSGMWGADSGDDDPASGARGSGEAEDGEAGWDEIDDDDVVGALAAAAAGAAGTSGGAYVVPREMPSVAQHWVDVFTLPAFHVSCGSFETALELLRRQIGLVDPKPLAATMMRVWASVNATRPSWGAAPLLFPITRAPPASEANGKHAPSLPDLLPSLKEKLTLSYRLFQEGKFVECHEQFMGILHLCVFATVQDGQQKASLREILSVAPEYVRALNVQLKLRSPDITPTESLQYALYSTHFKLHGAHLGLALSQAMSKCYKANNFKSAANVARRLLEQNVQAKKAQQATAIIAQADKNPTDAVQVDYDERNPFVLCSVSMKPMYRGVVDPIRCAYCLSPASPEFRGQVCPICCIAAIGAQCAGIQNEC